MIKLYGIEFIDHPTFVMTKDKRHTISKEIISEPAMIRFLIRIGLLVDRCN